MFCSTTLSLITSAVFTDLLAVLYHMFSAWQAERFLQFDTDNHLVCLGLLQPVLHKDSWGLKGVGVSQTGLQKQSVPSNLQHARESAN